MIIDVEFHIYTEKQLQVKNNISGKTERAWDKDGKLRVRPFKVSGIDQHLKFMDEAGIDMAALSINYRSKISLEEMKQANDFLARVVKENPKRFVAFAAASPLGGKPALKELERAVKELGMRGVHIWARIDEQHLDSRELWPFYEKVQELDVPIDLHVHTEPPGYDALHAPYGLYYVVARELDICAATFRLCLGGVLEDFPDLKFIVNHFGGGISAIKERLDAYMGYVGKSAFPDFYQGKPLISKPWTEYFNKLYFSMAGREVGMAAVKCALTNISPKKLLFATDWPFNYEGNPKLVKQYVEGIRKLDLPQGDIDAMLGGNAAKLLGIKKTAK